MTEYIEREAAKKAFCEYCDWAEAGSESCQSCPDPVGRIPAADVAPVRHGRWIETTQPFGWRDELCAECSVCGEDFVLDEWGMEDVKNIMRYCPSCGARMDLKDGDGE